jgi:deoxyribonuclease-4
MKLGSHVSMSGKTMFEGSVSEAVSYGANALMIYTGAPQTTRRKKIEELNIEAGQAALQHHGIPLEHVVVHAPYIMNLANPSEETQAFGVAFLSEEIRRSEALGATQIVLHPGAHLQEGPDIAIERIVKNLNAVIQNTEGSSVRIALETMAGKGTEVGRSFEEISAIIAGIEDKSRISVCFDTCHTHDAGYAIKDDFSGVLDDFDRIVGLSYLSVIHLNDSHNPQGAAKDRHANVGFGHIGFEALLGVLEEPRLHAIPKILETPYVTLTDDSKERVLPPYLYEIAMLKERVFWPDLLEKIRQGA